MQHIDVAALVDAASNAILTEAPRGHLGASQVGNECARAVWYAFRWAKFETPGGRMRRLWNRGHEEEHRLTRWLRAAGAEIRDYSQRLLYHDGSDSYVCHDWDSADWSHELDDVSEDRVHIERAAARGQGPKQWGFTDHDGHFAGSNDGKIRWPGVLPEGWGGVEYKTHNDKSWALLKREGVVKSKPTHFVQMQVYMHYLGLKWCLYVAVNKNDDHIHYEVVKYMPEVALRYVSVAAAIVRQPSAPKRLSNDPSFFKCKWCSFSGICHYSEQPEVNCRSCAYATPVAGKDWRCSKFHQDIPARYIEDGCDQRQAVK